MLVTPWRRLGRVMSDTYTIPLPPPFRPPGPESVQCGWEVKSA